MNYPHFQNHAGFEAKIEYSESECHQYFPFLENGFYPLLDTDSLFLIRIEGYGAIVQVIHEEELEVLASHLHCSLSIKTLPTHIARFFETQVPFHRITEIMKKLRSRVEKEGYSTESN